MENLNKKISQLGKLETVTGKEMIPVAINEKNNHVEIDHIKEYANNSLQEIKMGLQKRSFLNNIIRDTMKDLVLRLICFFLA